MKNVLYWLPRILAVLFIIFISIFALDEIGNPRWYIALPIHLIPSFILLALTVVAWTHERIGGVLFLAAGITMALYFHSVLLAAPVFLIGILFLVA